MAGYSSPTAPERLSADRPRRAGEVTRGWPGLGRLLADRWGGEGPSEVVRFLAGVQDAEDRPLAVRVRAAAAADPFLR